MSVGHVARLAEEAGIPTVGIYVKAFAFHARNLRLARTVVTRHPMGRPMGAPGEAERHREVMRTALGLLESAERGETRVEIEKTYRAPGRRTLAHPEHRPERAARQ